ncbi:unnamed protein product, partial [Candidula unifasciata]
MPVLIFSTSLTTQKVSFLNLFPIFMPCSTLGSVAWRRIKDDKFLKIGTMTWAGDSNVSLNYSRYSSAVTTWDLVIHQASPEDAGLYECQVTSRAGHIRLVQLNVLPVYLPSLYLLVSISITGKMYVDLGDKIYLICNASGGPRIPDEIDWFKAGDKIDSSKYRHVALDKHQSMADSSFISRLTIEHSQLSDTGDYICRSSRNDIASLKVTVLNAETANKRR